MKAKPGLLVARPLPLFAIGVLVINDHLLKGGGVVPAWLTGKLSDFAGLFFFPILLHAALASLVQNRLPDRARALVPAGAASATALVFTAMKVWPPFNGWLVAHWGSIVLDPTDLIALPMCAAAALWMHHTPRRPPRPPLAAPVTRIGWRDAAALVVAAAASMATSAPKHPPKLTPDPERLPAVQSASLVAVDGRLEILVERSPFQVVLCDVRLELPLSTSTVLTVPVSGTELGRRPDEKRNAAWIAFAVPSSDRDPCTGGRVRGSIGAAVNGSARCEQEFAVPLECASPVAKP